MPKLLRLKPVFENTPPHRTHCHIHMRWAAGGTVSAVLLLFAGPSSAPQPQPQPSAAHIVRGGAAGGDGDVLLEPPAWLRELEAPAIVQELRRLADDDEAGAEPRLFKSQFGPNTHLTGPGRADDWQALPLMNKGALLPDCAETPATCAALSRMGGHLQPSRFSSSEVGVRVLKLAPGASLQPHHGPGGRLVAHLGIKVPPTSTLDVAGQTLRWREGSLFVFDDEALHSAENPSQRPRYILHVAFPLPRQAQQAAAAGPAPPAVGSAVEPAAGDSSVVAHIAAAGVQLAVYANCSAVATNTGNGRSSVPGPLLLMYNRVADNRPRDWDGCVRATPLLPPDNRTLRLYADHGYGSVDIAIVPFARWLRFEVLNLTNWHGDPVQKHLQFASLCPTDLCGSTPSDHTQYPWPGGNPGSSFPYTSDGIPASASKLSASGSVGAENVARGTRHVPGTFTGWSGGGFAAGFLTITSNWQMVN